MLSPASWATWKHQAEQEAWLWRLWASGHQLQYFPAIRACHSKGVLLFKMGAIMHSSYLSWEKPFITVKAHCAH